MTTQQDVYASAFFSLELDGAESTVASLRSIEGGGAKAEVIKYQMGDNSDVWGQLGKPKFDDIKITCGLAAGPDLWKWMQSLLAGTPERRNGALVAADYNYDTKARRKFSEALLAGIGFPAWDASKKDPANITLTISPEMVEYDDGGGKINPQARGTAEQRKVKVCHFRFQLDQFGFDKACGRVNKVDAMEVKMKIVDHAFGNQLHVSKVPGRIEWPNLVFYLPEVDAQPFREYHQKQIIKGKERPVGGMTGSLTFTDNKQNEHGTFKFKGVQVFNVSTEKSDVGTDEVKLTKVECTLEGIEVEFKI